MLLQEFGATPESGNTFMMVNQLHRILIDQFRHGRNVVLIVDEAQNMPAETLEHLRMLSNLETSTDKLLQIVLAGQPDLAQVLGRNELRQLRQRIAVRATVAPLTKTQSLDYIRHRLAAVAANDTTVFTRRALNRIVKSAGGIPRTINILCDNALVTGYGYQRTPVDSRIVREVIRDLGGKRKRVLLKWGAVFPVLLLLAAGLFLILPRVQNGMNGAAPPHEYQTRLSPRVQEPDHSHEDGLTAHPVKNEPGGGNARVGPAAEDAPLPKEEMPQEKKSATVRIVKRGDTLYRMIQDVYGSTDYGLITYVRSSNPGIKDVNDIKAGDQIRFPEIPARKVEGPAMRKYLE